MRVHLINEIARRGHRVDLLVADTDSPYMGMVGSAVRVVHIPTTNAITGIPSVGLYLLRHRPRTMLSQRVRVNVLALRARALTHVATRMFVTVNTNMSHEFQTLRPDRRKSHLAQVQRYFPRNDGIIAVSHGVAEDTARLIHWPIERIHVAPNPVVTPELRKLASTPLEHPWFAPGEPPVILGVGRLYPIKNFPILVRAFAKVHTQRPCRLIILGEGNLRGELEVLAGELGIAADVELPGFVANPYAYMSRAGLFVLSSMLEGSPNALTEALAVGTPVVATDCPSGPREILEGGKYGPLVPVGDVDALAAAMMATLANPPNRALLQAAAERYTLEESASAYIKALGLAVDESR